MGKSIFNSSPLHTCEIDSSPTLFLNDAEWKNAFISIEGCKTIYIFDVNCFIASCRGEAL
jgi:hypothetical protein